MTYKYTGIANKQRLTTGANRLYMFYFDNFK
jgi:hypothetical protein